MGRMYYGKSPKEYWPELFCMKCRAQWHTSGKALPKYCPKCNALYSVHWVNGSPNRDIYSIQDSI